MPAGRDIIALNAAWITLEVAKWTDVVEFSLSILGAVTLLCINVLRLRQTWREHRRVKKS
tara:strand:+ start:83 stop:262 length:180 start_codon:yes stop_codon:yes gene_type:complete